MGRGLWVSSTMSPFPNAAWRGAAPEPRPRGALGTFGWPESFEEKTPGEGWGGARGCSTPAVFAPGVCGHSLGRWRGRAAGLDEQHLACPSSSSQSLSQLQLPAPVPQVTPSHPSQRAAAAALAFPAFCFCKSVFCTFCPCFLPLRSSSPACALLLEDLGGSCNSCFLSGGSKPLLCPFPRTALALPARQQNGKLSSVAELPPSQAGIDHSPHAIVELSPP